MVVFVLFSDAQKWTSKAKANDLLKHFLQPLTGQCRNLSAEGCLAQKPTKADLEIFIKNKNPFISFPSAAKVIPSASAANTPSVINTSNVQCNYYFVVLPKLKIDGYSASFAFLLYDFFLYTY